MSERLQVNDSNFESEIVHAELPSMVDKKYDGKFKVAKMNVDENPKTPTQYGVRAIPTILIFKDGKLADTIVGAVGKSSI